MKIVQLFEELNEFEPKPYESKKAEIAHLEKRVASIKHQRLILVDKLKKLEQDGIVTTNATIADKRFFDYIGGTGGPETNYRRFYGSKNNSDLSQIRVAFDRLQVAGVKTTQRIKDLTVRGSTYCFTGFRSAELEQRIEKLGGRVVSSAINGLNYLVADTCKLTGKMLKARENGAKIIGKAELEDFLRD